MDWFFQLSKDNSNYVRRFTSKRPIETLHKFFHFFVMSFAIGSFYEKSRFREQHRTVYWMKCNRQIWLKSTVFTLESVLVRRTLRIQNDDGESVAKTERKNGNSVTYAQFKALSQYEPHTNTQKY